MVILQSECDRKKSIAHGTSIASNGIRGEKRQHRLRFLALIAATICFANKALAGVIPEHAWSNVKETQFWMNFGGMSQHFKNANKFNQQNAGFGIEYALDKERSLVIGEYYNSVRGDTRYLGAAWKPLQFGPIKIGALAGMVDGYPKMRGGGFFPVVLPLLAFETRYVGLNLTVMPSIPGQVSGCVALQLKYRYR
ncbi:MAG: hypothetical protein HYS18_15590 [Burkholderiales bacterium]|nr:hypothetical protein [Burkholderiales bacterium]